MSPPNGDDFNPLDEGGFGFPAELEEQISHFQLQLLVCAVLRKSFFLLISLMPWRMPRTLVRSWPCAFDELARVVGGAFRSECLSVCLVFPVVSTSLKRVTGGLRSLSMAFGKPVSAVGNANNGSIGNIQQLLGIPGADPHPEIWRPSVLVLRQVRTGFLSRSLAGKTSFR